MDLTPDQGQTAWRAVGLLEQKNSDGSYRYSDETIRRFLPWLLLTVAEVVDVNDMPPLLLEVFAELAATCGVHAETPEAEIWPRLQKQIAAEAPPPELITAFEQFLREEATTSGGLTPQGFAEFLGERPRFVPKDGSQPAPRGSIKAGPFARFDIDERKKRR